MKIIISATYVPYHNKWRALAVLQQKKNNKIIDIILYNSECVSKSFATESLAKKAAKEEAKKELENTCRFPKTKKPVKKLTQKEAIIKRG